MPSGFYKRTKAHRDAIRSGQRASLRVVKDSQLKKRIAALPPADQDTVKSYGGPGLVLEAIEKLMQEFKQEDKPRFDLNTLEVAHDALAHNIGINGDPIGEKLLALLSLAECALIKSIMLNEPENTQYTLLKSCIAASNHFDSYVKDRLNQ